MSEEELFHAAIALTPVERAEFLDRACAGDAALRSAVEALIVAHEAPGSFLDVSSPVENRSDLQFDLNVDDAATADWDRVATREDGDEAPGDEARGGNARLSMIVASHYDRDSQAGAVVAGRYKLQEKIGEGGMGEVWVAKQTEPVKRKVALKLIKAGMDSRRVLHRFEQERQALALMDHPHIARVLDGGITPSGQPFFVMELVNGLPLTKFCDEMKLTPDARLELFLPICQAVQHAHQKGIVHRDLKPANILVTLLDGKPVPKIIDFGVAKALSGKLTDETLSTGFGAVVGTVEYMAPEQAGFSGDDVDTRADIYSLGVILYELLTGLRPLDSKRLRQAALTELIRIIHEEEPSKPSTRLSTDEALPSLAALRQTEPRKLMALLRGELDVVVMKCLEKQRDRRYETANELARDIQRYLADEVVEARPPSAGYRLRKFVRRNPLQLALAGSILLLIAGGVSFAWWQNKQAGDRREGELQRQLVDEQRAAADRAREARNSEALASLLSQAEDALRDGETSKATVAWEAAKKRVTDGGSVAVTARLRRLEYDLAVVSDLDAVDQFRWTWSEQQLPAPTLVAQRTREALRRFGADSDGSWSDDAAVKMSASLVKERIVAALDRLLAHEKSAGTRVLLLRVDADPYRDSIRDAIVGGRTAKLVELARQDEARRQSPGFIEFLAQRTAIPLERRRQLLSEALSEQPGNLNLLMSLAATFSLDSKESVDDRLRWYQAAVAVAPGNYAAVNNLGIALYARGEVEDAIVCYLKAVALAPRESRAHANLGLALLSVERIDEAIATCATALELDPKSESALRNLGIARGAKGQWDDAISLQKKAVALEPMSARAHSALGQAYWAKEQVDDAIACFRKALQIDANLVAAHADLGVALAKKGELDEAIECFRKALELEPRSAAQHGNLGLVLLDKGRYDEAIACYRKAVELNPKSEAFHGNLGRALQAKRQWDDAIACFRKVLELNPQSVMAHGNMGVSLQAKGRLDEAIVYFEKAIALEPRSVPGHFRLGLALQAAGRLDEAITAFEQAAHLAPQDPATHNNLGLALMAKSRWQEAIASFEKAQALDPQSVSFQGQLGVALLSAGRVREAIAAQQRAVALAPQDYRTHFNLGVAFKINEQMEEAIGCFQTALQLAPKNAAAKSQLAITTRMLELREQFQAYRKGEFTPASNDERMALIGWCQIKNLPYTATSLFAAALDADPKFAGDLKAGHRFSAATYAARAATGRDEDSKQLSDMERVRLRKQALVWLRADMDQLARQLSAPQAADRAAAVQALRMRQQSPDLAPLRDPAALTALPPDEQQACAQLWSDLAELLNKASERRN